MEKIGHDDELTYTNFSLYAIIHHEFDDRIRGINVTLPVCESVCEPGDVTKQQLIITKM
jgi:hypothetical protein